MHKSVNMVLDKMENDGRLAKIRDAWIHDKEQVAIHDWVGSGLSRAGRIGGEP